MTKLDCETIQQYIVYKWIQKNFHGDNIKLTLVDRYTILLKDGYDHALISFNNEMIYLMYSNKYNYKIEKIPFKKPYR